MNNFKKITGIAFLIFGFLGIFMCLISIFNFGFFREADQIFRVAYDGDSTPNTPSFFGLIALSGTLLLNNSSNNDDNKK